MSLSKYFGPSTLVAAAFIGPGTVTTCTLAGVKSGYSLLWAIAFSTLAAIILQEMAARLGFVSRAGLGVAIRKQVGNSYLKYLAYFLVIGAIVIGNAAYEAGNITGGALGLNLLDGEHGQNVVLIGVLAMGLLSRKSYQFLERVLIGLVLLMSISFLVTVVLLRPDPLALFRGFFPFDFSEWDFFIIMGLIGTTVVPYNLFLHASTIHKKYDNRGSLEDVRRENRVSIALGGLISMMIIITAAAAGADLEEVNSASDLAVQLEPLYGTFSKWLMAIGLLAAGLSSAVTAPLAASYAASELFDWKVVQGRGKFLAMSIFILLVGMAFSLSSYRPILIIQFAQVANAFILPILAIYLLWVCNQAAIMKSHTNTKVQNLLASTVILICLAISAKSLLSMLL
jgi:manganese transport protein